MRVIYLFSVCLFACGGNDSGGDVGGRPLPDPNSTVPLQGERILGMDIKEVPTVNFVDAYNAAIELGVREVSISLDWELLEPTGGNYMDTIPDLIDLFYSDQVSDVTLIILPLDTPGARYPSDLTGNFDDAAVITAFDKFLVHLHSRLSKLNASGKLKWIQVGKEIDSILGTDSATWAQWKIFFDSAKNRIKALWPNAEVSSVIQFGAIQNQASLAQYLTLLPSLDNAAITYYPLKNDFTVQSTRSIVSDFDLMANAVPEKTLFIQECGYPSNETNASSENDQADFISEVFTAWDKHLNRIAIVDFSWQYDISELEAGEFVEIFGLSGSANESQFKSYLSSIGLSNHDATEKRALQRLREELKVSAWRQ